MKRTILSIFFLCVVSYSLAIADSISLEDVTVNPGEVAELDLVLNNSVAVRGFQFVVTPSPVGNVTFSEASATGRAAGWIISTNASGDGMLVIGYSPTGASLEPGNEAVLTFKYSITAGAPVEKIDLLLTEVTIADANLSPISDLTVNDGQIAIDGRVPLNKETKVDRNVLPRAFFLQQNYPNPFNPTTTINYSIPEGLLVHVSLKIYDLRGNLVRILINKPKAAGIFSVFWNGEDKNGKMVASGIYIYRLQAGDYVQIRKMVLLK